MNIFKVLLVIIVVATATMAAQFTIRGIVRDSVSGTPLSGTIVRLSRNNLYDTTDSSGEFSFKFDNTGANGRFSTSAPRVSVSVVNGLLALNLTKKEQVTIQVYSLNSRLVTSLSGEWPAGSNLLRIQAGAPGVYFCRVRIGDKVHMVKYLNANRYHGVDGYRRSRSASESESPVLALSAVQSVPTDSLFFTRSGYYPAKKGITPNATQVDMRMRAIVLSGGVRPGTWEGVTSQHKVFSITVAPDGRTLTSMAINTQLYCSSAMGTSGRIFSVDGQFPIPSNGSVNIGDSIFLQFMDTLVSGTFKINTTTPGSLEDGCMNGACIQYNNGAIECSYYHITNPTLFLSGQVTFSSVFFPLRVVAEHGLVTKTPDATNFLPNESVQLVARAETNYHFIGWSADAQKTSGDTAWVTMDGPKTVTANFKTDDFLTINSNGTIERVPDKKSYIDGDTVRLVAKPGSDLCCVAWSGDTALSSGDTALVVMNGDRTVNARFTQLYDLLTNSNTGTILRYPHRTKYMQGDSVRLVAFADTGHCCPVWFGDTLRTNGDTAWVIMTTSRLISVDFTAVSRLFVNSEHGTVVKTPDQPYYITSRNDTVTLEIRPDPGYRFTGWDGPVLSKKEPVTRIIMNQNRTVNVLFEVDYRHAVYHLNEPWINAVGFSPDGSKVAFCLRDSIVIREKDAGTFIRGISSDISSVNTMKYSPDGSLLLVAGQGGIANLLQVATGLQQQRYISGNQNSSAFSGTFSSDGQQVLIGFSYGSMSFETLSGTPVATYYTGYKSVAFTPDGLGVMTGSADSIIRLYNAKTGELNRTFAGKSKNITAIRFSGNGTTFHTLSGSDPTNIISGNGHVQLFDYASGEMLKDTPIGMMPLCCDLSSDGSKAAGATYDNKVRVVETGTGKLTHTLSGHTGRILAIAFSPDGSQVLTGAMDSTAILWDLR